MEGKKIEPLVCRHCDEEIPKHTKVDASIYEVEVYENPELQEETKEVMKVNVYVTCPKCGTEHYRFLTIDEFETT